MSSRDSSVVIISTVVEEENNPWHAKSSKPCLTSDRPYLTHVREKQQEGLSPKSRFSPRHPRRVTFYPANVTQKIGYVIISRFPLKVVASLPAP